MSKMDEGKEKMSSDMRLGTKFDYLSTKNCQAKDNLNQ